MKKCIVFMCLACGHAIFVRHRKALYMLGNNCEKCKGPVIEKGECFIGVDLAKK